MANAPFLRTMGSMHRRALILIALVAPALCRTPLAAQDLSVVSHADVPPATLADAIKALLDTGGQRVTIGATQIDFWWVKAVPLKSGAAPASWSQVAEGTMVGAARLSATHTDIRGRRIKAGIYTLRYGIQPNNGDHLGVSPFREFLLLSPAALDTEPAPIEHDPLAELSGKSIGSSHPATWSLDPPAATADLLAIYTNDAGHKGVILQIPAAREGRDAGLLRFGLILIGEIEA